VLVFHVCCIGVVEDPEDHMEKKKKSAGITASLTQASVFGEAR
jgi:hypothetical protein